jgi:hypothetical protein
VRFWNWLFGSPSSNEPVEPTQLATEIKPIHLARGRGYTFEVVGESHRQDALDAICGGKCEEGHNLKVTVQLCLVDGNPHDPNAVGVFLDRQLVAYIPRHLAAEMRANLLHTSPEGRPVTCDAKVVGGWDRGDGDEGHYGLKLSLAEPLRVAN